MRQQGQAMVEMLVVTTMIIMLLWGLLWLQRWQQIKLQTQHHAALQAFRFSHSYELDEALLLQPDYLQGLHSPIAHSEHSTIHPLGVMPDSHVLITQARDEAVLGVNNQRWRFQSLAQVEGWRPSAWSQSLFDFIAQMKVQSQTSIWVGAGHANDDLQAVERLKTSYSLWTHAQGPAAIAIQGLTPLLIPVDSAWGRSAPSTQWLQPWEQSVPAPYLN